MDLTPLRHRDYRLLFIAQFVSLLGTMITYVALPYQMYRATGSTLAVGLLGVAELVPLLATAFIGGALADAVDRRRMVIVTDIGLAAGSVRPRHCRDSRLWRRQFSTWSRRGCQRLGGLQRPSLDALVRASSRRTRCRLRRRSAMFRGSVGMIAGPAIGGVLIAAVGLGRDLPRRRRFDLCRFAVRGHPAHPRLPPPEAQSVRASRACVEGFRYARSRQELIGTYVVDFVAMVFGMPLALFPALADRLGGPSVLGLLYAAPAVGALVASLTSRWTPRVHRHGLAVMLAAAVVGHGDRGVRLVRRRWWPALVWPGARRRRGRGQRHLPHDDVEPDDPRRAARPAGGHRDGELHERSAARQRRGGSRWRRCSACARP